jgi:valyl-tRNA synthetase
MQSLMDVVRAIRNARVEYNIPAGERIAAVFVAGEMATFYNQYRQAICALAHLDSDALTIADTGTFKPAQALAIVEGGIEVYLPLGDVIDLDAEKERIAIDMEDMTKRIAEVEIRLRNESFTTKAPKHVVQRERDKRDDLRARWERLRERLAQLYAL